MIFSCESENDFALVHMMRKFEKTVIPSVVGGNYYSENVWFLTDENVQMRRCILAKSKRLIKLIT